MVCKCLLIAFVAFEEFPVSVLVELKASLCPFVLPFAETLIREVLGVMAELVVQPTHMVHDEDVLGEILVVTEPLLAYPCMGFAQTFDTLAYESDGDVASKGGECFVAAVVLDDVADC